MEEDEETPKAIPPWVELEYAVRKSSSQLEITNSYLLAHAHACRS
jgi:hypothetical protein